MPIYNYTCTNKSCAKSEEVVERLVKMNETDVQCAECASPLEKQFSSVNTHFTLKGSGWYNKGS
jgi:putative FmdB family regulatory protein